MAGFTENEVLLGRFRITGCLGRGAYGCVWRADDQTLNRPVAIKQFEFLAEDSALQEARKVAKLSHPNIIQVYDVVTDEPGPLIIMEYAPGGSLNQLLQQRARLGTWVEAREAVDLLRGILEGVNAAHAHEDGAIIHRDLKPVNIMLVGMQPKIADFGIAAVGTVERLATALRGDGRGHLGSMYFMSPEQLRGEALDHRSDLFNVGLIAFLLLGRRHPFADPALLFHYPELVLDGFRPIPALDARPAVTRAFHAWVLRLLERQPDDRFPSASAALEAIQDCVADWTETLSAVALELAEQLRQGEVGPETVSLTAGEVAEAISVFRLRGNYPQAIRLFERGAFDFASLPPHLRQRMEDDYNFCKRRDQREGRA